jgi:hypothetical protein
MAAIVSQLQQTGGNYLASDPSWAPWQEQDSELRDPYMEASYIQRYSWDRLPLLQKVRQGDIGLVILANVCGYGETNTGYGRFDQELCDALDTYYERSDEIRGYLLLKPKETKSSEKALE